MNQRLLLHLRLNSLVTSETAKWQLRLWISVLVCFLAIWPHTLLTRRRITTETSIQLTVTKPHPFHILYGFYTILLKACLPVSNWFEDIRKTNVLRKRQSCSTWTYNQSDSVWWECAWSCSSLLWIRKDRSQHKERLRETKRKEASAVLGTWARSSCCFLIFSSFFFLPESCPSIFLIASA